MNAKEVVATMWQALMTAADPAAIETYVDANYRQHSPYVKDGPQGLRELVDGLRPDYRYELVRIIGEGEFAVMHGIHHNWLNGVFSGGEAVVGFDMFRVANNRIAEHWDASVPLITASVSGRSQLEGATQVERPHLTATSESVAENYVKTVLIGRELDRIGEFVAPDVLQHSLEIGDGIDSLKAALAKTRYEYKKIHHVIAEGEFVAVHCEGEVHKNTYTFWDLFRLDEQLRIAEQWHVAAVFPDVVVHTNGAF
ncbi:nuclear transport factor 2 family protein [Pseudomonas spelaei]|nr:nuclear transport factor 2 family protein [Pseudomonas spelaei]